MKVEVGFFSDKKSFSQIFENRIFFFHLKFISIKKVKKSENIFREVGREESWLDIFKVKLWKEELFRQDVELPGVSAGAGDGGWMDQGDVVFESSFLVVCGTSSSGGRYIGCIQVFQLAADNVMENLNTSAPLIKTVQFPGFYSPKLLCNQFVWGCLVVPPRHQDHLESSLVLFEKTALLDAATPPEQTPGNRVHLGTIDYKLVDMNTTSLVFIQESESESESKSESESSPGRDGQEQNYLCKKDFWMPGNTVG